MMESRRLAEPVGTTGPTPLPAALLFETGHPDREANSNVDPTRRTANEMTVLEQLSPSAETVPSAVPESEPRSMESSAVVAVVMDFVGATLHQFDQLLESMRLSPNGPGVAGSLFQWSRHTPDGVRVTEVWQSHNDFQVFLREEIKPRIADIGMREPEITTYEVHSYLTQANRRPASRR